MSSGRSQAIVVVASVSFAISTMTVCVRCFVRYHLVRAFGWDDVSMLLASIFNIGTTVCSISCAKNGCGKSSGWLVEKRAYDPHRARLYWWLGQKFYIFVTIFAKISICVTLWRVAVRRAHNIILFILMGTTIVVSMLFFFATVFECRPVSSFWNFDTHSDACGGSHMVLIIAYLSSAIAAVTDFSLGLLPWFMVWDLQRARWRKAGLALAMGLGCIAGLAVIARMPFLVRYQGDDFLDDITPVVISANVESGLGITAGSLATLRPIVRFLRGETVRPPRRRRHTGKSTLLPA
ncbi:hypothetical protein BJX68DRAFT_254851 [Aspergillus pseudodeflectus]|uniref:Rhodopsin domain-containing protein n=1 Tax=Aspergillus pseudodeflectus TaxID=176178 RepID=A0ABR4KGT1_9EURO